MRTLLQQTFSQGLRLAGALLVTLLLLTQQARAQVVGSNSSIVVVNGTLTLPWSDYLSYPFPVTMMSNISIGGFATITFGANSQGIALGINIGMAVANSYQEWADAAYLAGAAAEPTACPFGDSVPNLLRYAMNLGTSGQGQFLPQPFVRSENGQSYLVLQYRQRSNLSNVALAPQFSTDLKNWTDLPASQITRIADADGNTLSFEAKAPIVPGQYCNLRVVARSPGGS